MKKCGPECEAICGFCEYYKNNKCQKYNIYKHPYDDCDCNKFKCFTLSYYYNKDLCVDKDYLFKLMEDCLYDR